MTSSAAPGSLMILMTTMITAGLAGDLDLPDPLKTKDGEDVTTSQQWHEVRRPEILELFREHVYGRAPVGRPEDLRFEVVEEDAEAMNGAATRRQVEIRFSGPGGQGMMPLVLFIPNDRPRDKAAPGFLLICHRDPEENIDPLREEKTGFWPAEKIVRRGYAAAAFDVDTVDPDEHDGFRNGVHGIFDPPRAEGEQRAGDAWGTIAAWAWGASRAMDYLETDPAIDARRVAVIGHSRGGKTALWAGAQDERFALVISNNSGCTGAALARRKQGETIQKINDQFPHWFCRNYRDFNGREDDLPVDQHMLIALMAPRPVYVASATGDNWADPPGEFLSCVHAGPVYRLFELRGVGSTEMPPPDQPLQAGSIAYHLRSGKHNLTPQDWGWYMDYADKMWER